MHSDFVLMVDLRGHFNNRDRGLKVELAPPLRLSVSLCKPSKRSTVIDELSLCPEGNNSFGMSES